jgi:anti-sigma regulatory factor (Ser/Thr protein kinase)
MSDHQLSERWPAEIGAVAPIRHAVTVFARSAGASQRRVDDVALAITEAATNAVLHGFAGTITVLATTEDHSLHFDVADDGRGMGFDPGNRGLGLGLAIIARLADDVRISAVTTGGTRLQMRFSL